MVGILCHTRTSPVASSHTPTLQFFHSTISDVTILAEYAGARVVGSDYKPSPGREDRHLVICDRE